MTDEVDHDSCNRGWRQIMTVVIEEVDHDSHYRGGRS